ncbi:dorsal-ventral patterning protein Sog-like [Arctopsyche grandis]|uniref:dorsal-ventral patterning protein Sog-like n=1 Tax=Arctopsyche grandis TaxID=121162 RepID=UPI00406D7584
MVLLVNGVYTWLRLGAKMAYVLRSYHMRSQIDRRKSIIISVARRYPFLLLFSGLTSKTMLAGPDTLQDVPQEEDEKIRHFAALLRGNGKAPAAARFSLRRRSLYVAIEGGAGARALQLLDRENRTLQELPLGFKLAGRACTSWRRLPRDYRRLLREGKVTAALVWPEDAEPKLFGQIITHPTLNTEMFSSLLEVQPGYGLLTNGWGATAAISASAGAGAGAVPSLYITLMFTGVLNPEETMNVSISIKLEVIDKNITIIEEVYRVRKPAAGLNIIELSSPVSVSDFKLLARGRLALSVEALRPNFGIRTTLRGPVLPKLACELFYAPLVAAPRSSLASGVTWLHLNREGDLIYTVQVDELNMKESPMIMLRDESNKRHIDLELAHFLGNGIFSGSLQKIGKIFEPLYAGNLSVDVTTRSNKSVLKGRLVSKPIADAMDLNGPTLLKRVDLSKPADVTGLAWISVDYECTIQWEIVVAGPGASALTLSSLELWLDLRPNIAPGAPVISRRLGNLELPEGALLSPARIDLHRLQTGACELIIRDPSTNVTVLRAMLKQIKVPETCISQNPTDNSVAETASCFHSGSYYDDGAQWTSANEPCTMCSCHHGIVRCDAVLCPPPSCGSKAVIYPGECCPRCLNSSLQDVNTSSTQGCHFVGQFHHAGQSWHPYLPPGGFDNCTVCTCELISLKVSCTRLSCPLLDCPDKHTIRPDKKACCRVCMKAPPPEGNDEQKDVGSLMTDDEILAAGGCKYIRGKVIKNGDEFHPVIHSHGVQKCDICSCKDGYLKCDRKRCTRSACNNQHSIVQNRRRRQPKLTPLDECCQHCRRNRRHQKHRRDRT